MGREIERKFLVRGDAWRAAAERSLRMEQGYLGGGARASVRVRIAGSEANLNIKGGGYVAARAEYEYAIPFADGRELLDSMCLRPTVVKTRHFVPHAGRVWEVDEFDGDNRGLIVAEIELDREDERIELPPWAGAEVTQLKRYYNVCLVEYPYSAWAESERAGP